jgi:hypothetical protein
VASKLGVASEKTSSQARIEVAERAGERDRPRVAQFLGRPGLESGKRASIHGISGCRALISSGSRAAAGNVYRHDYEDVRERAVWITVQRHLPPLLAAVEQELRQLGDLP